MESGESIQCNRKTVASLLLLAATMMPNSARASDVASGLITGQVVLTGTKVPVPDALVVAKWGVSHGNLVARESCPRIVVVKSDANGWFSISAWSRSYESPESVYVHFSIYKPGYTEGRPVGIGSHSARIPPTNVTLEVTENARSASARADELDGLLNRSACTGDITGPLQLYRAMYAEILELPASVIGVAPDGFMNLRQKVEYSIKLASAPLTRAPERR